MFIANVNEDGFENNPYLDQVREIAKRENAVVVPVCAEMESELSQLDDAWNAMNFGRYGVGRTRFESR